jgi:outer membrane protein assembly factor BamB
MTDASAPRSLNCPNCGAPLDFPPRQASVRCRFCDSTIERSVSDLTDDDNDHVIQIDASGLSGPAGPARRFVLKMRNGEPVVVEVGQRPAACPSAIETDDAQRAAANAARRAAAARADRRRAAARATGGSAAASPAKGAGLSCALVVIAPLLIGGIIAVLIFAANPQSGLVVQQLLAGQFAQAWATFRTVGSNLVPTQSGVLLTGADGGSDQAILLTILYPANSDQAEQYRLIAVDVTARKLLWQSDPLAPKLYSTPILADADQVYIVSGANLLALRRADGTTAWSTPLADKISFTICRDCLQLVDGRLAALSDDGTLAVYAAATGELEWTATSIEASPRGLYVLGGRFAFMDRNAEVEGLLRAFDQATGREITVKPVCLSDVSGDEYADWTTPLWPSADGGSVYLSFGYSPACLQRLDARTLKLVWSTQLPDDFTSSLDRVRPVLTADALYLAYEHQVLAIEAAQGTLRRLVQSDDAEFVIEAVHGSDLVLQARRTRGSTRFALWNVDTGTGETRWTFDLGDSPPVEPAGIIDENTPEWLVHPSDDGLRLLRFQAAADDKSHGLLNETLDWQTGESSGQQSTVLNLPTIIFNGPAWTVWQGNTLWMVIDGELMGFDTVNNRVVSRWP